MERLVASKSLKIRLTYSNVAKSGDYVYHMESNDEDYLDRVFDALVSRHDHDIEVDNCGFEIDYNKTESGIMRIVKIDREMYQEVVDSFKELKKELK